ncbi:hypothetical protein [Meiothermus granaticius]|uniref:Uncharacterized protein n=1 Tax=Meiothermus granaticius NBRC 107808 TaxID=1227551 RepID=A0A399FDT1_9DEIN|nr:hypothetical protein [Meiothermus granaticius]RIH93976.1 hypothetical protein Mgrana_00062 [Meiothermus granaticius NBRC 107808]GEM88196.1 hypothetical protein MGR01S_28210 [Meiothermus granaticius NBRC 107808]
MQPTPSNDTFVVGRFFLLAPSAALISFGDALEVEYRLPEEGELCLAGHPDGDALVYTPGVDLAPMRVQTMSGPYPLHSFVGFEIVGTVVGIRQRV